VEFNRLIPEPGTVEVRELLASARLADLAPPDRPYTLANFVSSADGRATFAGRSGKLGDDGDRAMFHALREQADAILAGTGTLRTERYGRLIRDDDARERRAASGREPEPLATVVTRTGNIPMDIPMFAQPELRVLVFSANEVDTSGCAADVEVVQLDPPELTLTTVLRRLRADRGVRLLLCEGGPTIFSALLHEDLADELFLTLAPKLTGGGTGPTVTSGPELPEPRELRLEWALERNDSLYLRYSLHK
jgi:5-amino-6-(5-phosphoribosylamino)uracil reductase